MIWTILVENSVTGTDVAAIFIAAGIVVLLLVLYIFLRRMNKKKEDARRYLPEEEFENLSEEERYERLQELENQRLQVLEEIVPPPDDPTQHFVKKVVFTIVTIIFSIVFILLLYQIAFLIQPFVFADPELLPQRILVYIVIGFFSVVLAMFVSSFFFRKKVPTKIAPWNIMAVRRSGYIRHWWEKIFDDLYLIIPWVSIGFTGLFIGLLMTSGINYEPYPDLPCIVSEGILVAEFSSKALNALILSFFLFGVLVWQRVSISSSKKKKKYGLFLNPQDSDIRETKFFLIDLGFLIATLPISPLLWSGLLVKIIVSPITSIFRTDDDLLPKDLEGKSLIQKVKVRIHRSRLANAFNTSAIVNMTNQAFPFLFVLSFLGMLLSYYDVSLIPSSSQICCEGFCGEVIENHISSNIVGNQFTIIILIGIVFCGAYYLSVLYRPMKFRGIMVENLGVERIGGELDQGKINLIVTKSWIWKSGYFVGFLNIIWIVFYATFANPIDVFATCISLIIGISIIVSVKYISNMKNAEGKKQLDKHKVGTKFIQDSFYAYDPAITEKQTSLIIAIKEEKKILNLDPNQAFDIVVTNSFKIHPFTEVVKILSVAGIVSLILWILQKVNAFPTIEFEGLDWLSSIDNLIYSIIVIAAICSLIFLTIQIGLKKTRGKKMDALMDIKETFLHHYETKAQNILPDIVQSILNQQNIFIEREEIAGIIRKRMKNYNESTYSSYIQSENQIYSTGAIESLSRQNLDLNGKKWSKSLYFINSKSLGFHFLAIVVFLISCLPSFFNGFSPVVLVRFFLYLLFGILCTCLDLVGKSALSKKLGESMEMQYYETFYKTGISYFVFAFVFPSINSILFLLKAIFCTKIIQNGELDLDFSRYDQDKKMLLLDIRNTFKSKWYCLGLSTGLLAIHSIIFWDPWTFIQIIIIVTSIIGIISYSYVEKSK